MHVELTEAQRAKVEELQSEIDGNLARMYDLMDARMVAQHWADGNHPQSGYLSDDDRKRSQHEADSLERECETLHAAIFGLTEQIYRVRHPRRPLLDEPEFCHEAVDTPR